MKLSPWLAPLALLTAAGLVLANDYDESTDGDISDDHLVPDTHLLEVGSNVVEASQQGNSLGRDIDYLTVVVPTGMELSQLVLDDYVADIGDLAFLGVQAGDFFTVPHNMVKESDLLGGLVYGEFDIGDDILPAIGMLSGATGFTPPLPAGSYTFWLNQTGGLSTTTLDFIVTGDSVGTNYCTGNVNSTGAGAILLGFGSDVVLDNEFTIVAQNLPIGTPGLAFFGPNQVSLPFGEGLRCVGGGITRMPPVGFGSSTGQMTRTVDLTASPAAGVITSGTTHNFQYWYRDPMGGPVGFNLTNGLSVTWN